MRARCGHCNQEVALELESPPKGNEFLVRRIYPAAAPAGVAQYAPDEIRGLIEEGFICLGIGALVAAALVGRTAIQAIARDKLGPDAGKSRSRLVDEIDQLELPNYMKEAGHGVRIIGNAAAHDAVEFLSDVDADTVRELLDLTVELVRHLYENPQRAAALRAQANGG